MAEWRSNTASSRPAAKNSGVRHGAPDNIGLDLLPALRVTLEVADCSDFFVGYFNLRGWKSIDEWIEKWAGGTGQQCRLLVGMQRLPQEELRAA